MRITTFFNHETLMNQVTLLRDALHPHLAWHGARLSFVAAFLIALLRVKTVNFSEWPLLSVAKTGLLIYSMAHLPRFAFAFGKIIS
jgi:hypothetical protein